jgi:hypothetical protein
LASFNADTAAHGQILHEWKIKRNDYTWEVTIGRPFIGLKDEIYLYGFLGGAKIGFSETAKISGVSHKLSGTLTDVNAFLLGGGMDIKLAKHVLIGLDLGFMIKDFLFANSISQPDGSGNEFQLRIRFGGFQRFELGKP